MITQWLHRRRVSWRSGPPDVALTLCLLSGVCMPLHATEVGLEAGVGFSRDAGDTYVYRLVGRLPGTAFGERREGGVDQARAALWWEASVGGWRYRDARGRNRNLADVGFGPVLRFRPFLDRGWFLEGGLGAHYLSDRYERHGNRFSTRLQFGSHLGVGYAFADGHGQITLRIQHLSNGGIKKPNPGVEFALLNISRTF